MQSEVTLDNINKVGLKKKRPPKNQKEKKLKLELSLIILKCQNFGIDDSIGNIYPKSVYEV